VFKELERPLQTPGSYRVAGTRHTMKTKTLALIALSALVLSVFATVAVASTFSTSTSSQVSNFQNGGWQGDHGGHGEHEFRFLTCQGLTVGETVTASGLVGDYWTTTSPRTAGTASGTFTFKVMATYSEGCALSITSGSFALQPISTTSSSSTTTTTTSTTTPPTTYTITGGNVVLGIGSSGSGSGTTSGGGSFLIQVDALRVISTSSTSSTSTTTTTTTTTATTTNPTVKAAIGLDFKIGANEFLVHLQTPVADPEGSS